MSLVRIARIAALVLVVAVMLTAGLYVLVYLARWEWNRAIVSGVFFLAALIVLSTILVLRGLRRVEDRLRRGERTRVRSVIAEEGNRRAARRFDWLREPPDRLSVFIPVLLGAGVLLSSAAYVLERLAGAVAGLTLDRRTARLVTPDLPLGDGSAGPVIVAAAPPSSWRRRLGLGALLAVSAVVIGLAVDAIGDVTQSRPEVPVFAGTTVLELDIDQRGDVHAPEEVAASLWVACRNWLPPEVAAVRIEGLGPDAAVLVLDRRLGEIHRRRFTGCLEDLTLDAVLAEITSIESSPASP